MIIVVSRNLTYMIDVPCGSTFHIGNIFKIYCIVYYYKQNVEEPQPEKAILTE